MEPWLIRLYNDYRTVTLNSRYYAYRLERYRRWNTRLEIFLAVVTTSAVGGFGIFAAGKGPVLWAVLSAAATILGIAKPIMNLPASVERYSRLYTAYYALFLELQDLVVDVATRRVFTAEHGRALLDLEVRARKAAPDNDPVPDEKLRRRCLAEVNQEIPPDSLWFPPLR